MTRFKNRFEIDVDSKAGVNTLFVSCSLFNHLTGSVDKKKRAEFSSSSLHFIFDFTSLSPRWNHRKNESAECFESAQIQPKNQRCHPKR